MYKFQKFIFLFFFALFLTAPFSLILEAEGGSAILANEVLVIDNGFEYKITSNGETIQKILENAEVGLQKEDVVFPKRDSVFRSGTNIIIERATPVILNVYNKKEEVLTQKERVGEVLEENGIRIGPSDLINIKFDDEIFPGIEIKIWEKPKIEVEPEPEIIKTGEVQIGDASWYNYIPGNFCASLTFGKGTKLLVTNLENGKSVIVTVNDSGPFSSKIIDLEKTAFSELASLSEGVIQVRVEELTNN